MAAETLTPSAHELPVGAEELHRLAKERVAARQGTLNEVRDEIQVLAKKLMENPDAVQGVEAPDVEDQELPPETEVEGTGEAVPSPEAKKEIAEAQELHQVDMVAVHGDSNAHLFKGKDARGFYSGGNEVYLNEDDGVTESVWRHEDQHRRDGFIEGVGLDEPLAGDVKDELPAFVDARENDELLNLVQRDPHEKRATEAGGETPAAYKTEHVDPTKRVIERMDAVGLDGKNIVEQQLIVGHDVQAYRDAVKTTLLRESLATAA